MLLPYQLEPQQPAAPVSSHVASGLSLQFVDPYKSPEIPDYLTIKKINDDRVAREAEAARIAVEEARKAQVIYIAPVAPPPARLTGDCESWMIAAGITDMASASQIFAAESGCNPLASNSTSAAHGVCQALPASKMAAYGTDYLTNPITQMRWCQDYAISRYGGWHNAWQFWATNRWW